MKMRRWLPVAGEEWKKCVSMPAFYVLLLFCIGFNVFLLINTAPEIRESMQLPNNFLFGKYFRNLGVESIVILTLILLYSMHYEKMNRTENLVLTCRCGENIFSIKMMTTGAVILLFFAVL